jgi:hypothetical protein
MVDLRPGLMVVETPPQSLGMFHDRWWQWIVDFGLPGPDRGEGGRSSKTTLLARRVAWLSLDEGHQHPQQSGDALANRLPTLLVNHESLTPPLRLPRWAEE